MSTYTPGRPGSGPTIRLVDTRGHRPTRKRSGGPTKLNSKRVNAWIARSIMLATTGFAFFDLLLMATGAHR